MSQVRTGAMLHPLTELVARYGRVVRMAWAHRKELAGPARLADEAAFLPAALSLQETPVHPAPRRFAWTIMILFCIALAWAMLGKVDIVAVAPGRIVVSDRTKTIQPLERSVVKRVLVRDGDRVQVGQPLVELDPTVAAADKAQVDEQLRAAESEAVRAAALLAVLDSGAGTPNARYPTAWPARDVATARAQLVAEWADISSKISRLDSELSRRRAEIGTAREMIAKLEAMLPLALQRERDFARLVQEGYMSGHAGQDRLRERVELERDLMTQRARLAEVQAALRESESASTAYVAETRRALRDREAQAEFKKQQAMQDLTKATQREKLTVLTSPAAGTVQQLAIHTTGGVVMEAQTLMVIVPDEAEVTAEVTLENKDIGFVDPEQDAEVKLETFPFTRYGTVRAVVSRVSADAVLDEKRGALFPATLTLRKRDIEIEGRSVRLSPGMNVTAEIKTGRRRVIEYLLSPIGRIGNESLRER